MAPRGINRPGFSRPMSPGAMGGKIGSGIGGPTYKRPSRPRPTFQRPDKDKNKDPFRQPDKINYLNQITSSVPQQEVKRISETYQRPADVPGYLAKMRDYRAFQQAQANDGIARLTQGPFKGRQILSMREPELTAVAPTFTQLLGDVGRGAGSVLSGIAKIPGQAFEAYQQISPLNFVLNQVQKAYSAGSDMLGGARNLFRGESQFAPAQAPGSIPTQQEIQSDFTRGMNPGQINLFYNLTGAGMSPDVARQQVLMRYANGGIATLN